MFSAAISRVMCYDSNRNLIHDLKYIIKHFAYGKGSINAGISYRYY